MANKVEHDVEIVLADLVVANRILANEGVLDAFGHVSVRDPKNGSHFWMSRSLAPASVTRSDVLCYDLTGQPVEPTAAVSYQERFIHSSIYACHPHVMAVAHTHSPTLIPFANGTEALRPMSHITGFLGKGAPIFEIRDYDQGPDMLIRTPALGDALARCFQDSTAVVLMRGHGSTVIAKSIYDLVWRAIYSEVNAQQQIQARQLGPVRFLSEAEAKHAAEVVPTKADPFRAWNLWKAKCDCSAHVLRRPDKWSR